MKKGLFIKIISVVLILAVLSGAAGCGSCNDNSEGGGGEQTAGITLSSETLSLTVGETATLTYTANDELSAYMPLWNSSNTVIASVNGGEVRAISEGKAEIILVLGSESVSCELTVSAAAAEEDDEEPQILIDNLPVTGRMDMYVGDTYVIEAGIYVGGMPAEGDVTAAYSGEDGVIGIDGKTVTAVKEGDAEILLTAEYEGMQVTKTLQVTVKQISYMILSSNSMLLHAGQTAQLSVLEIFDNGAPADVSQVTFTSNDAAVASVDAEGVISAKKKGTAVITVSYATDSGNIQSKCTLVIEKDPNVIEDFETGAPGLFDVRNPDPAGSYTYAKIIPVTEASAIPLNPNGSENYMFMAYAGWGRAQSWLQFSYEGATEAGVTYAMDMYIEAASDTVWNLSIEDVSSVPVTGQKPNVWFTYTFTPGELSSVPFTLWKKTGTYYEPYPAVYIDNFRVVPA